MKGVIKMAHFLTHIFNLFRYEGHSLILIGNSSYAFVAKRGAETVLMNLLHEHFDYTQKNTLFLGKEVIEPGNNAPSIVLSCINSLAKENGLKNQEAHLERIFRVTTKYHFLNKKNLYLFNEKWPLVENNERYHFLIRGSTFVTAEKFENLYNSLPEATKNEYESFFLKEKSAAFKSIVNNSDYIKKINLSNEILNNEDNIFSLITIILAKFFLDLQLINVVEDESNLISAKNKLSTALKSYLYYKDFIENNQLDTSPIKKAKALYTEGKKEEAIYIINDLAEKGNDKAQYLLGKYLFLDKEDFADDYKAFTWFKLAAKKNNTDAQYMLSICYYTGRGTAQNYEKAFYFATLAAEKGHIEAIARSANFHLYGHGTKKDIERAIELFEYAAAKGSSYAKTKLLSISVCKDNKQSYQKSIPQKNITDVHPATYIELINMGYTSHVIAESLVKNDMNLYFDNFMPSNNFSKENEGSVTQWAEILSSIPESFQYLVNADNEIVGNFSFISISEKLEILFKQGSISESDFTAGNIRDLASCGNDHIMFLLNLSVNLEYSTVQNNMLLRKMFLEEMLNLARAGITFKKIITNVFKASHCAFLKTWGFKPFEVNSNIYELKLQPYPNELYYQLNKSPQFKDINEELHKYYSF